MEKIEAQGGFRVNACLSPMSSTGGSSAQTSHDSAKLNWMSLDLVSTIAIEALGAQWDVGSSSIPLAWLNGIHCKVRSCGVRKAPCEIPQVKGLFTSV